MKQYKQLIVALPAALLLVGVATPAVVLGESSPGSESPSTVISDTGDSGPVGGDDLGSPLDDRLLDQRRTALEEQLSNRVRSSVMHQVNSNDFHLRGQKLMEELVKGRHKHSDDQRRKNCQAAQSGLEHRLTSLQSNSQKYQNRIDKILSETLSYQKTNNVSPDGLADLLSKASDAQSAASDSVASLQSLSVNLDCGSSSVAQTVADFKASAKDTRDKLLAYRSAVKDVVLALLHAKEGSDQ